MKDDHQLSDEDEDENDEIANELSDVEDEAMRTV